jgi:dienelactone hydrolase
MISRIAAALLLAPAALAAQTQPERAAFVIRVGADTIALERFTRTPASVEGELTIRNQARIGYTLTTSADARATGMRLRAGPDREEAPRGAAQEMSIRFAGDTAIATAAGQERRVAAAGAIPFVNPSFALMEQMLMRGRRIGGRDSVSVPMLEVNSMSVVPARIRWLGADSAVVAIGNVEMRARVDAAGRLLGVAVPSQRLTVERVASLPASALAAGPAPDYSPPAGAPYGAREVRVPTPAGHALAGTLTLPAGARGRVPAVVTITGSGLQDRDSAIPGIAGYRPFRQVADTLSRRGIAVLRLDDRGAGASGGDPSRATTADLANDARAAVAYLRTLPEIDPERIALLGHSEGGIIAPMVAADDRRVRAVVVMAGPASNGRRINAVQNVEVMERQNASPTQVDSVMKRLPAMQDSIAARSPWFRFWLDYDPVSTARRLRAPTLILQGATDRQVPAHEATRLAAAIREGGNTAVTVRVFPRINHLFLRDPQGSPTGYADLPSKQLPAEVLGPLADWLAAQLRD